MSSIAEEFQPQPGDEPDDVLFNTIYGLRTIELNRPKKLNSLNGSMARKIVPRLQVRQREGNAFEAEYLLTCWKRNGPNQTWQMSSS